MMRLGEFEVRPRLNEVRNRLGLTQERVAELTGIPQASISRFDKSRMHVDAHIFAILMNLNLKYEDLFEIVPIKKDE